MLSAKVSRPDKNSSVLDGILDGKGRLSGGIGFWGVGADSSTASRSLSSWSFASASSRSFSTRASRASSSAILLRSDSRSDISQGISFRASFGERILIPLTGGKCFGFDVMIALAFPAIAAAKKISSAGSGETSTEYQGWTSTPP